MPSKVFYGFLTKNKILNYELSLSNEADTAMLFMNPVICSKNDILILWKIQNKTLKNCNKPFKTLIHKGLIN